MRAHLDIALLQGQSSVAEYPLRVAAFSNVFSVSLFFVSFPDMDHIPRSDHQNSSQSDSVGDEMTRIYYVCARASRSR